MKPQAFLDWPKESLPVKFGPYRAVLDRVVDGDTYIFLIDAGMGEYIYKEIRLADASCPESNTPAGRAAKAYAEYLMPRGSRVILSTAKIQFPQTFTRFAAVVHLESYANLAGLLVEAGKAQWGSFEG